MRKRQRLDLKEHVNRIKGSEFSARLFTVRRIRISWEFHCPEIGIPFLKAGPYVAVAVLSLHKGESFRKEKGK